MMKSKRPLQQGQKPPKLSETLEGTERSSVRAVQRALRLLECFSEGQPTLR